jgi:type I restriction enzyme, R subunit
MPTPEDRARENIDRLLTQAGWAVRDQSDANILAYRGVAIRNFTLKPGHGFADYLLYVDGRAAGVVEARKEGVMLTGCRDAIGEIHKRLTRWIYARGARRLRKRFREIY